MEDTFSSGFDKTAIASTAGTHPEGAGRSITWTRLGLGFFELFQTQSGPLTNENEQSPAQRSSEADTSP